MSAQVLVSKTQNRHIGAKVPFLLTGSQMLKPNVAVGK